MPVLQRRPRRAVEEDEDGEPPRQRQRREAPPALQPDEEDAAEINDEDEDVTGNAEEVDDSAHAQLVKKLVRYALACEYARIPIRRDGIRDKVFGSQSRALKSTFEGAQKQLRAVFGMQMVEMPVREKLTQEEKRKAIKSKSKDAQSNAYMLVTILPDEYRTSKIIHPSKVMGADEDAAYVATYTLIISLITLNGGELSDPKLKRYLRRMNAETNVYQSNKTEDVLAKMIRQGYLQKTVNKDARQQGNDDGTTWYVGSRGKVEIGNDGIANMVREVYGQSTTELESRLKASLKVGSRPPTDGARGLGSANGAAREADEEDDEDG